MKWRSIGLNVAALVFALCVIGAWQVLADLRVISPAFFPPPSRAIAELYYRATNGLLWPSVEATSVRMLFGWLVASIAGILLGAAIGSSRIAKDFFEPTLEFVRPLPASAIIPVAILFLGLTNQMSVAVIAFGAIWPVLLSSIYGFSSISPRLQEVSALQGLSTAEYIWKIAIPSATPDILSGVRVSLAISLILAVVTEMQASLPGLGRDIFMAQRNFRSAELFSGLIVLGLLGFVVNFALVSIEKRALRWRRTYA